jgi:hypothetical protein
MRCKEKRLLADGSGVSQCRTALECESNLTRDHGATGNELRHPWVGAPSLDSSRRMRRMTVTAASCSSRPLLSVTFACAQLGSRSLSNRQRYGSIAGVAIRDIAGMLIAMYACTKQRAAFRLATCMQHSRQLSNIAAQRHGGASLSQKHHQLVDDFVEPTEANDSGPPS